jgi:hypothetical protein
MLVPCGMSSRLTRALACGALVACGSATNVGPTGSQLDAGIGSGCPLTPAARQLLGQVITRIEGNVNFTIATSQVDDPAIQWWVVGTDAGFGAFPHLAVPCTAPQPESGETCNPLNVASIAGCFRTGCEGASVLVVDQYVKDKPPITYDTSPLYPSGTVTYNESPQTRWRYDFSQPGAIAVSAAIQQNVVVTLKSGEIVRLTFSGQTGGTQTADGNMDSTTVSFPQVSDAGPIDVNIQNHSTSPLSGTIVLGSEELAVLSQRGNSDPTVLWQGSCSMN